MKFFFKLFIALPWWINIVISLFFLSFPTLFKNKQHDIDLSAIMRYIPQDNLLLIVNYVSWVLCGLFIITGYFSWNKKANENKLFKKAQTIKKLYQLDWLELENVVKLLFSKNGYRTKQRGGAHADGGVDIEAYKNREKTIIQCKQWKSTKVGVAIVREMFGVMIHEKAQEVYIITCGSFTKEAKEFAKGKPVHLIHGFKLVEMINKSKM